MRRAFIALVLCALSAGCVPITAQTPDRDDLFLPLRQGELSTFEHNLAIEKHSGRADAWTDLGDAFLRLASCESIGRPSKTVSASPQAHLLYQLVLLEDLRRLRLIEASRQGGRRDWHRGTIHTKFTSRTYFNRRPERLAADLIRWPSADDVWMDEWPAPIEIAYECDALLQRPAPLLPEPFEETDPTTLTGRLLAEWLRTEEALATFEDFDEESPAPPTSLQVLTSHRADLVLLLRERRDLSEEHREFTNQFARQVLDELAQLEPDDEAQRLPANAYGLAMRQAQLALVLEEHDHAVAALQVLASYPSQHISETAQFLLVKLAWSQGWWTLAADSAPELLPPESPLRSAHAYFAATAHRFDGREDSFFGLAREALRDRRRAGGDVFMGALYREVLRQLARFDVDERTLELLEELGPRSRLGERRQELAEVAIDIGRPAVAEALVGPLLEEIRDNRQRPRLYAILALAAFLRDDRTTFDKHLATLANRPAGVQQAVPQHRRSAFFAHQDSELARVLRAMLPMMAEWGDDDAARALRQIWLTAIVEHTQRFLRWAPESVVSESLTELYNLAGQLLEDHPRGYAKRVGSAEPSASALVLGTVELTAAPSLDLAPTPLLRWPAVDSLLLIPYGAHSEMRFVHDLDDRENGEDRQ